MKFILLKFRPAIISPLPGGIVPDKTGMWGHFGLAQQVNAAVPNSLTTLASQNTLISLAPVELISARLMIDGAQGSGVTLRTPSGPAIISFLGNSVATDGSFASRVRVLNSTTQTITVAGSTGVITRGTMTIADAAYRDFLVQPGSNSTVTITNLGGGTT